MSQPKPAVPKPPSHPPPEHQQQHQHQQPTHHHWLPAHSDIHQEHTLHHVAQPNPRPPSTATPEFQIGSPNSQQHRYGASSSTKKDDSSHFGKKIFHPSQLETIGMAPANFRLGGKKHVSAPYSILDNARDIIRSSNNGTPRSTTNDENGNHTVTTSPNGRPLSANSQSLARKQERRLIESLIMFPSINKKNAGDAKKGEGAAAANVPVAFQDGNRFGWKPSGPHDHIPDLPEAPPKPPHAKIGLDDDPEHMAGTFKFCKMNAMLIRAPIRKPVPQWKPALHTDQDGKPKTTNSTALVDKLWRDMENRKNAKTKAQQQAEKEDAAMCKYGPNAAKYTDEDFAAKFRDQALTTRLAKMTQLNRKYVPAPKKHVLQKGEMEASTDRLYYQARQKSVEAHAASRKKYVEDMQPKFAKISQEEVIESANRLSSREHAE